MVAGARHRNPEEIGIAENGVGRREAASGVPVDSDALQVDLWVAGCELFDGVDVVGDAVVAHVAVPGVVEALRAVGVPRAFSWTTKNPSSANAWALPPGLAVKPQVRIGPICGPG